MIGHKAKIFNERIKSLAVTVNTLATAVMILGVLRPQMEALAGAPVANIPSNVNILWVSGALVGYGVGLAIYGLMKPETEGHE